MLPGAEQDWQMEGGCMLTNSEWLGINELSLLIHGTDAVQDMERYFWKPCAISFPLNGRLFLFHEDAEGQLVLQSPVFIHMDPEIVKAYGRLINTNGICRRVISLRRTMAYRSSDLVTPDEQATDAVSEVRTAFLLPNDVQFYSGIVLTDEWKLLGKSFSTGRPGSGILPIMRLKYWTG